MPPAPPAKAFQCLRVPRKIVGQEFEGDEAAEVHILGFIDHTHSPTAESFDDAVVRDSLTYHEWRRNSGCNLRVEQSRSQ